MITRFTRIKGIGRYYDYNNTRDISFGKNTVIFGANTAGKSTLTDILWSFKTGNTSFIEGRRTFGFLGNQEVEFYIDNTQHTYPGEEWQKGYPNIEIFDSQFINENIFEGNEINYDHQKNLHNIIIGPKGKKLAVEINSLQEELDALTARKTAKTSEFNKVFKKEISPDNFRKLSSVDQPDKKIAELNAIINNANNQAKIQGVFDTIELQLSNIITQSTKQVLSSTIEVNAEIVAEHILKTWKEPTASKNFLQTGASLMKDDQNDCVFCGQHLSATARDLLDAYGKLFSQRYKSLQEQIIGAVNKFEKWQPVVFLNSIQDKLSSISLKADSISDLIKKEILSKKESADKEFDAKLKDIGYTVDFETYDSIIAFFIRLKQEIEILKSKNVISGEVNIADLTENIKKIEFARTRHTEEWDNFFEEYDQIENIQEGKKRSRERLREALNEYSTEVFNIHLDTINKVLQELNADFKIFDFQPIRKLVGQKERIFALEFFDAHKISIDETSLTRPNFKNTLSESDKRVLAFAFFYSLMIHDENLKEKIIVFDDPFSSFDFDRRTKTAELLANPYLITEEGELITKEVEQLIVLTHETEFFKWIFLTLESPKALRIVADGHINGVKKSTIEDLDVMKEFIEVDSIKYLREIEDIYSSNEAIVDFDELSAKCRKVLEAVFKRKYLFDLDDEIKQRKSVRSFIEKLRALGVNDFDNDSRYNQYIGLCNDLNIELPDSLLKSDGKNTRQLLADFLRLIKLI